MKLGDRTNTYQNLAKIPQSDARHLNMFGGEENRNPAHTAQEYNNKNSTSKFNSLFSENINEMQTASANGSSAIFSDNVENIYL